MSAAATTASPRVDVVVVSYNSGDTLRACVEPLAGQSGISIYVVDNDSPEPSLETIAGLPVMSIRSGRNGGFAFGCNIGLRQGNAPYVLFLNPDASMNPAELAALARTLDADPGLGLVGPRLLDGDGMLMFSQRRFPTSVSTLAEALFLHRIAPHAGWAGAVMQDPAAYEQAGSPGWVSGAAMLARRSVLEQIGGLDEDFFLYSEDTDLCARVRAAGFAIRFDPIATARHIGGCSAPRSSLLPVMAESRVRYATKHHRRFAAGTQRAALALHALTHALVSIRRPDVVRGQLQALRRVVARV